MIDALVLFCGGPAIYDGLPKPLQNLRTGETLIERYFEHIKESAPSKIILLVEQSFEGRYLEVVNKLNYPANISVLSCKDESSTFEKLKYFLETNCSAKWLTMLSYPDIFTFEELNMPETKDSRLKDKVFISYVPVFSRFPRLVVEQYLGTVRGISNHVSAIPSNPLHIYGGHLIANLQLLTNIINEFLSDSSIEEPSLEFDLFYWLVNKNRLVAFQIYGQWVQADSPREIEGLIKKT